MGVVLDSGYGPGSLSDEYVKWTPTSPPDVICHGIPYGGCPPPAGP